jgi:hypothetical protein
MSRTTRTELTPEQLVARISEETVERVERMKRCGVELSFNEAARVLAEVINEQIDAGAYITDDVCRQLVGLIAGYDSRKDWS